MFRIKIALIVGGFVLAFFGVQEFRLSQGSKVTPQTISCADLSAKGPGDNANVVMTDFLLCEQFFVYESKKNSQTWQKVWVPAVPLGGEYQEKIKPLIGPDGKINGTLPVPQNIKVIVKSSKVTSEAELGQMASMDTLTGLVTNRIESIGSEERKILEGNYPGTDFSQCYILDHDRKPAGMGQIAGFFGGGIVLSLLGLVWMIGGRRSGK